MPSPTSAPQVLLVEGRDDERIVVNLCKRVALQADFSVVEKGDVGRVLDSISPEVKVSGRVALGVLVDADDSAGSRWQALKARLRNAGVEPPDRLEPDGIVIEGTPRVGIWLMPNNTSPGELEDFIAAMIPSGDRVWPLAQSYISAIPSEDRKFPEGKATRAEVHAWLATLQDPRQMGTAIVAHDLDVTGESCRSFVRWLGQLFGQPFA